MKPIEIKTESEANLDVQLSKVTITDSAGKRDAPSEVVLITTTLDEVGNEVENIVSLSIDEAIYLRDTLEKLINLVGCTKRVYTDEDREADEWAENPIKP